MLYDDAIAVCELMLCREPAPTAEPDDSILEASSENMIKAFSGGRVEWATRNVWRGARRFQRYLGTDSHTNGRMYIDRNLFVVVEGGVLVVSSTFFMRLGLI